MHSALRYFIFFFSLTLLVGCKKPIPDPENLDPIFRDLKGLAESKKKAIEEAIKSRNDAYIKYQKEKPNTLDKKLALREYDKWSGQIDRLEQEAHYFEIRANRRKIEDKVNYMEAFKADKQWPPQDEYSGWLVNRRLAEAPRTWGTDLPKLYNNGPVKKPQAKKAEEKEE